MPDNAAVNAALAFADKTMNQRLREARATGTDHDYDAAMESCIDTLAAAVRDLREQIRVLREAQGEADVRLAGVEAERDFYRDGLAEMTSRTDCNVKRAYLEGFDTGFQEAREADRRGSCDTGKECWMHSDSRRAMQAREGA